MYDVLLLWLDKDHEIFFSFALFRGHEIPIRAHEIVICGHEIVSHEIFSWVRNKANEKIKSCVSNPATV